MAIETVEDIVEWLADQAGIWGCCKAQGPEGCLATPDEHIWCRLCWTIDVKERIRKAIGREYRDTQEEQRKHDLDELLTVWRTQRASTEEPADA